MRPRFATEALAAINAAHRMAPQCIALPLSPATHIGLYVPSADVDPASAVAGLVAFKRHCVQAAEQGMAQHRKAGGGAFKHTGQQAACA